MHWGHKIITGMILFMIFILGMSYYMFLHHTDTLVDEDYYEQGIEYDKKLVKLNNALDTAALPAIKVDNSNISISFKSPSTFNLAIKRPADAALDKEFKSDVPKTEFVQSITDLKSGLWLLELNWKSNGKEYIKETYINK